MERDYGQHQYEFEQKNPSFEAEQPASAPRGQPEQQPQSGGVEPQPPNPIGEGPGAGTSGQQPGEINAGGPILTKQPRAVFGGVLSRMRPSPEEVKWMLEAGVLSEEEAQELLRQRPVDQAGK